jgi:predicted TIM-barrel enzyme
MAHGVIVGSSLKEGGHWANRLDPTRVRKLMDRVREVRKKHVDATMIM